MSDHMKSRPMLNKEIEVEILCAAERPYQGGPDVRDSPVTPVRLTGTDTFCFSCHKDQPCWNRCCHGADITITPFDVVRLSRRLGVSPEKFLADYTVPDMWDKANLPLVKLKMAGEDGLGACAFVTDAGCSVYDDRPVTCRYYPLGLATAKMKGAEEVDDFFFMVKEERCKGHMEKKELPVSAYREEQGVEDYDRVNRGWMDILMKTASWKVVGGPYGKEMSPQMQRMFFLVSTDIGAFRRFVFETRFLDSYEIDKESVDILKTDDEALLLLGFDWMKSVMFNEPTISLKETVLQGAIAKARSDMGAA